MSRFEKIAVGSVAALGVLIVVAGACFLLNRAPGQRPPRTTPAPRAAGSPEAPLAVQAPSFGTREGRGTGGVRGLIRDGEGRPVAGARVNAFFFDGRPRLGEDTVAKSEGEFVLEGLEPGTYTIRVRAGEGAAVVEGVEVPAGSVRTLESPIVLEPAARVQFEIRDGAGAALAEVRLSVRQLVRSSERGQYSLEIGRFATGASGEVGVDGLPDGAYEVSLSKEGYAILNDRFTVARGKCEPKSPLQRILTKVP